MYSTTFGKSENKSLKYISYSSFLTSAKCKCIAQILRKMFGTNRTVACLTNSCQTKSISCESAKKRFVSKDYGFSKVAN